jgi:hypothetical protein
MKPEVKAEIVTDINFGDRLLFARFEQPMFIDQRFVGFIPKEEKLNVKLCHALMNSLLGLFYIEAMGTGRGDGALDLSKNKFEDDFMIINPEIINQKDREKILRLFRIIEVRASLPIMQELERADRKEFDTVVLESVGLLAYAEKIKESLLTIYKIRKSI